MLIDDRKLTIGASVGLSRSSRRDELTSSELLRRSDMAMYVSKEGGKNRCTWFSDDFDKNRDVAQQVEADLREALRLQEFRLAYQPLVDAQTGDIVAVEALLRWQRADGSMISPGVFIPIAEKCGLIYPIGLWVLRKACRDALDWDGIKLSINVSPAQLRNPEFPIELGHILEETGFPPARLELEVTETYLVTDPLVANRNLDVIRKFGVGIALDDFGTGYASIGFLRNFRFEKLKLDRTMIVDAGLDNGSPGDDGVVDRRGPGDGHVGHRRRRRDRGPGRHGPHRRVRPDPGLVLLQGHHRAGDPRASRRTSSSQHQPQHKKRIGDRHGHVG